MPEKTVLVIDDSATIRKLVDSHLSPAGYRVVLAPSAEAGIELANEIQPDLILLDHQLPGTTGHQVATDLTNTPSLKHIPVVISSTLRKKAYAEYVDLDNVVDMLPKPYTEELLRTTVANALETAAMIIQSQSQGGAVPETINPVDEASLAGNFGCFSLRELIDFLNNGNKSGVLEVEGENTRIRFHLDNGRIQAVYGLGISPEQTAAICESLPASLATLAPVLKMTLRGNSCAEIDGFVQLLDQKVLDPRLMSKLLRFQAAMMVRYAFTQNLTAFRFESGSGGNNLQKHLPLDISLLALLVEGAIYREGEVDESVDNCSYVRRAIRGQNLDRAGLSARHMKVLNVLSDPKDTQELQQTLGWEAEEVQQVLEGFVLAELVERRVRTVPGQFVIFEPDAKNAQILRESLAASSGRYVGKVVRDKLALQLLLKRCLPHTMIFSGESPTSCGLMAKIFATKNPRAAAIKRIAIAERNGPANWMEQVGFQPDAVVTSRSATALYDAMDQLLATAQPHDHPDRSEPPHQPTKADHPNGQYELMVAGAQQ
jgi:CheY-like chemotaxis protein